MRLIDADELRPLIQREYNTDDSDYPTQYQIGLHYTMTAIDKAPTIEPQRIKGRWVGTDYDGFADGNPVYYEWKCSECGCVIEDEEPTWNFCPFCGSDMRGENDAAD